MKIINSFYTNEMDVQLCLLFLLYALWGPAAKQSKDLYLWQRFLKVPPQQLGKKQMQPMYLPAFVLYAASLKLLVICAVKNNSKTNGIAQYVMETNHEIDWENRKFLDSESHWRRRKIKEALFIDCLNPQKEVTDSIMNLEKGLEISECWKEFNQDIRKVLFKIVPIKK